MKSATADRVTKVARAVVRLLGRKRPATYKVLELSEIALYADMSTVAASAVLRHHAADVCARMGGGVRIEYDKGTYARNDCGAFGHGHPQMAGSGGYSAPMVTVHRAEKSTA